MESAKPAVLFVDHDESVRSLKRLLREVPIVFLSTSQPKDAMRIVAEARPVGVFSEFDLDADQDGLELLMSLKARYPKLRCVLFTNAPKLPQPWGADIPVLAKDVDPGEIVRLVEWMGASNRQAP